MSNTLFDDADLNGGLVDNSCPLVCCSPRELAVVDLETTGLDPKSDEIVEIAIVVCGADGVPTGERFVSLVKPSGSVGATHIHGISEDDVRDAPTFADIAGDVLGVLAGRVVVAHNAYFDVRFLGYELGKAARSAGDLGADDKFPMFATLCTMWSSQVLGLGGRISLVRACNAIGYEVVNAHSALDDTLGAAALVSEILRVCRTDGVHVRKFGDPLIADLDLRMFPGLVGSSNF